MNDLALCLYGLWIDIQVRVCRCLFAYSDCKYTFYPGTLILIQLAVGPYKITPGKYLHYSMLIASLMAGAECSIVAR